MDFKPSKELTKCFDIILYILKPKEKAGALNSKEMHKVTKLLSEVNFTLQEFLMLKYTALCYYSDVCLQEKVYSYDNRVFVFKYISIIEILKFNLLNREVQSLDDKGNPKTFTVEKYLFTPINLLIDIANVTAHVPTIKLMLESKISDIASQRNKHVDEYIQGLVIDQIDIGIVNLEYTLVNTINRLDKFVEFTPIKRNISNFIAYSSYIEESLLFRNRAFITSGKGNVLLMNDDSVIGECVVNESNQRFKVDTGTVNMILLKEILLWDKYPFIVVSTALKDGTDYTTVIPLFVTKSIVFKQDTEGIILLNFLKLIGEVEDISNSYEVVSPYYWRYRDRKTLPTEKEMRLKYGKNFIRKDVEIYMHKAKMGNPSKEAQELAKKLFITLEPGETLVKTHIRHYGLK